MLEFGPFQVRPRSQPEPTRPRVVLNLADLVRPSPVDDARARAEAQLAERQRAIQEGAASIESAFAPLLDPAFLQKYQDSIVGAQQPQLERQFRDASGTMATGLARRGMLDSTFGANEAGRLDAAFADETARIRNNAKNQSQQYRGQVEGRKTELLDLNSRSADPMLASARARGEATSLVAPSPTTDIGTAFAGFMQPFTAFRQAEMYSPRPRTAPAAPVATGAGSGRIVR